MALFTVVLFLVAVWLPFFPAKAQDQRFADLSTTLKNIQTEVVNKHNDLRRGVSPPPSNMLKMQWNTTAAANAQNWANKCLFQHSKREDRRVGTRNCGENLFMSSYPSTWSNAIQNWYDEVHDFVFEVGPKSPRAVIGHFTQIVWYSSFLIGCGVAYCPKQSLKYLYVCQYCPAGNIVGKQHVPYQKGTPCGSCPNHCDNGLCTNSCEYEDTYSNCASLKATWTCASDFVKTNCKAACNCQGKIY